MFTTVTDALGRALSMAAGMFLQTFWALVLGFAVAGLMQAFVPRVRMRALLGGHGPGSVVRASLLGAVSSSCSYAAAAMARALHARGAAFSTSVVFMVASTNLVVELGIVAVVLLGWQIAAAEIGGGLVMIALLALLLPRVIPESDVARQEVTTSDDVDERSLRVRLRDGSVWRRAARYTIADLAMVRREIVIGFVASGFLAAVVPTAAWADLFVSGHGAASALENAVVGPVIALLSCVCSVGNVALAAALWAGGSTPGGVVSFILADLVTLPLLLIYRRYWGTRVALRLGLLLWGVIASAGLVVDGVVALVGASMGTTHALPTAHVSFDPTTVLDVVALVAAAAIALAARRSAAPDQLTAIDPICHMQVERATAPARYTLRGETFYFCCERCRDRFTATAGDAIA